MKRTPAMALCLAVCLSLVACQPAAEQANSNASNANTTPSPAATPDAAAKKPAPADFEALAERLVTQSARVKEGDIVLVAGATRDVDLLEAIAVNVRKVGGYPLVTIGSDRMGKRMFTDVPEKYDSQAPTLDMKLNDVVNVIITVDTNEVEGALADVPPARLAARAKASVPANKQFLKNNVRLVEVGNGLYPTSWRAKRFEMTDDEMSKMFWGGVGVDFTNLQAKGEQVSGRLAAGKEMRITKANGTDLKLRVEGRPVIVSDGIISDQDLKKGGGAVQVFLPAGEVMTTPVPGSAEGKVVVDKLYFQGKEVQNLTLEFAAGKLTSMTGGGDGFAPLKAAYDAADAAGKEMFGFVDLGINESVRLSPNSKIGTWVPAGMITIGVGGNLPFGGDNEAAYALTAHLPGTTVTLDGQTIVENGTLKI